MLENNKAGNLFNRPFGLNVQVPSRTIQQVKETATKVVSNLWEPVSDYFEKADTVINGDVQEEIQRYNRMAYSFGSVMRQGQVKRTFNINA